MSSGKTKKTHKLGGALLFIPCSLAYEILSASMYRNKAYVIDLT